MRGLDRITAREPATRAMVSGAAFHRDKCELVEQIFAEAMVEMADVTAMSSERLAGQSARGFVPGIVGAMSVRTIVGWLDTDRPSPPQESAAAAAQLIQAVPAAVCGDDDRP
ncbi:hypothetical protein AB0L57_24165 [Nocardia sp. NPDC052254]|uniref:hypothetical protein n=1 Tax=Nocardia sp. NPDC052254 TaxID=3155681 RepID=UPI00343AF341